jgi:DNA-binding transcriptional ArsR family regulator
MHFSEYIGGSIEAENQLNQRRTEIFQALAHPVRLRIIELLEDNEVSVTGLQDQLELPQAHISHQLAILRRAGLVTSRRLHTAVIYRLADKRILSAMSAITQFTADNQ